MSQVLPVLVQQALDTATQLGFPTLREDAQAGQPSCSLPDTGRVLAMLAAGCHDGRIGEIGTGVGVGTAWMVSAMPASANLVTVEFAEDRASAAARLFHDDERVRVVHGDANLVMPAYAPFDLLFVDGGWQDLPAVVDLLRPGGRVVVDDVTPVASLPADSPFRRHDPKRAFFFSNPRLVSAEIVLPDLRDSVLVGTRTELTTGRRRPATPPGPGRNQALT